MQFHLDGFQPGDPEIFDPAERHPAPGAEGALPAEVDVLIVGCGPAGLTLAAQLSAFPDIKTCIVEQKDGPLLRGQADGIACRTMEMFEAFGFCRARAQGSLLDQRDDVLEARRQAARQHHPQRPRAGRRGRAVGIPACGHEPGAGARFLSRPHGQVGGQAQAVLRAASDRSRNRRRRPPTATPIPIASPPGSSGSIPGTRARPRRCARAMSWAATARAARCANRSGASCAATRPITPGA